MSDKRQPSAPRPEPLRFFGTTWVERGGGYALRRTGLAAGSLLSAVLGALVLRFGFQGLAVADVPDVLAWAAVVLFAICGALAFRHTWKGFVRRPEYDPAVENSMQSVKAIGFIGVLLAWFVRSLLEAPGERLRRAEYERARELYERRRTTRTGNPAARKRPGRRP
ncbi:hypothetical protein [Streptomyces zingiberis]|uniref:EamA/RhaT family transporter n=1 Tax=Streptomyces zingiberis TaxID=2053010 RepID=A0ABX1C4W2_9ACTN|nr:hypothetical protein [Streptomyces zingiberis]NJQ03643.1 hypothetical protein [Streptomyces zingiberis]